MKIDEMNEHSGIGLLFCNKVLSGIIGDLHLIKETEKDCGNAEKVHNEIVVKKVPASIPKTVIAHPDKSVPQTLTEVKLSLQKKNRKARRKEEAMRKYGDKILRKIAKGFGVSRKHMTASV